MQKGTIRRLGTARIIGRWQADLHSIAVDTDDPELKQATDEVLGTPQTIPVHAAERLPGVSQAEPLVEVPARIRYLALFALELEARGFEIKPEEE